MAKIDIIRIPLSVIRKAAASRPEGYVDACLAAGRVDGEYLTLTGTAYDDLRRRFNPSAAPTLDLNTVTAIKGPPTSKGCGCSRATLRDPA